MKNKLILLFLILIIQVSATCAQSVQFQRDLTWNSLLATAKASDKLILIDVYTEWCGPCKKMDKEVFTDAALSKLINENLISYKLDAEKGMGPALAKKYHVPSFPTYLFIKGDGTLIYRASGYMPADAFAQVTTNALLEQQEPVTLVQLDSMYATHKSDTLFMYQYLVKRTKLLQDNADLLDEYCELLNSAQQSSLQTLQLIADNGNHRAKGIKIGTALDLLLKNQDKLLYLQNTTKVDDYIALAQRRTVSTAISLESDSLLNLVLEYNKLRDLEVYDVEYDDRVKLKYYYETNQHEKYLETATSYLDDKLMALNGLTMQQKNDAALEEAKAELQTVFAVSEGLGREMLKKYSYNETNQLIYVINETCNSILTITSEKEVVKNGLRWMEHSLALADKNSKYHKFVYPSSLRIYAMYLYQAGEKTKAIQYQKRACKLIAAKGVAKNNEVVQDYNFLLDEMIKGGSIVSYQH